MNELTPLVSSIPVIQSQEAEQNFLDRDIAQLSIKSIPLESELVPILEARLSEAQSCMEHSPLATIFLCGSILEGVLLGVARKKPRDFNAANNSPKDKDGKVKPFPDWSLAQFIDVAHELNLLSLDVKKFGHALRDFRNYIHPYQQMREKFVPDTHTAKICLQVLNKAISDLSRGSRNLKQEDFSLFNQHQHATALALANLVGSWDEHKTADLEILNLINSEDYSTWILKARTWLALADSPVALKNGCLWSINQRVGLWQALGSKLFDPNLDMFKSVALLVLREPDPAFELAGDQRFAATIYGKVPSHSPSLRKGLAEGMALLGNHPDALVHCSRGKAEAVAALTVRELFADADWALWGSLNPLLPTLAEAAPDEFLRVVENALNLSPCPFDELFAQEGNGMTGGNYLTGLLWALESLAWDEAYLVRVCLILGELASHDPGGKWTNRPSNSLSTILLPWLPQTMASVDKRKVVLRTLHKEWPEIAWALIINLLHNQHQISMGCHKPAWRNTIPEDWEKGVTHEEYWQQISFYAEQAVLMAGHDPIKLGVLIDHFSNLPNPAYDQLLAVLASAEIIGLNEDLRQPLWEKLLGFVTKHRLYPDAEWSADEAQLTPLEAVAEKLAPVSPFNRYQSLFANRDFGLYEDEGSWDEKRNKLDQRRQDAIKELLHQNGLTSVIQFAEDVKAPNQVGQALGNIANDEIDGVLLPEYLNTANHQLINFVSAYICTRFYVNGWTWSDGLYKSNWTNQQISQFFSQLPFEEATWQRVAQSLGKSEADYWQKAWVNPYQKDSNLAFAVDKLIEHGRPLAAIDCLGGMRVEGGDRKRTGYNTKICPENHEIRGIQAKT